MTPHASRNLRDLQHFRLEEAVIGEMERGRVSIEGHAGPTSIVLSIVAPSPGRTWGHIFGVKVRMDRMGEDRMQDFEVMMFIGQRLVAFPVSYSIGCSRNLHLSLRWVKHRADACARGMPMLKGNAPLNDIFNQLIKHVPVECRVRRRHSSGIVARGQVQKNQ
jgi:hypothetical protein